MFYDHILEDKLATLVLIHKMDVEGLIQFHPTNQVMSTNHN